MLKKKKKGNAELEQVTYLTVNNLNQVINIDY